MSLLAVTAFATNNVVPALIAKVLVPSPVLDPSAIDPADKVVPPL
jgi:hypothetical protein